MLWSAFDDAVDLYLPFEATDLLLRFSHGYFSRFPFPEIYFA